MFIGSKLSETALPSNSAPPSLCSRTPPHSCTNHAAYRQVLAALILSPHVPPFIPGSSGSSFLSIFVFQRELSADRTNPHYPRGPALGGTHISASHHPGKSRAAVHAARAYGVLQRRQPAICGAPRSRPAIARRGHAAHRSRGWPACTEEPALRSRHADQSAAARFRSAIALRRRL